MGRPGSRRLRVGGKILIVVGIALDAYKIYTATDKAKAVAEVAGGWTAPRSPAPPSPRPPHPPTPPAPSPGQSTGRHPGRRRRRVFHWLQRCQTIYELTIEGDPVTISGH